MPTFCKRLCKNFRKEALSILISTVCMLVCAIGGGLCHHKSSGYEKPVEGTVKGSAYNYYSFFMVLLYTLSMVALVKLLYELYLVYKRSKANYVDQEPWACRITIQPERIQSNQPEEIRQFDIVNDDEESPSVSASHPSMPSTQTHSLHSNRLTDPLREEPRYIRRSLPDSSSSVRTISTSVTTPELQSSTPSRPLDVRRSERIQERNNPRARRSQRSTSHNLDAHLHM